MCLAECFNTPTPLLAVHLPSHNITVCNEYNVILICYERTVRKTIQPGVLFSKTSFVFAIPFFKFG